MLPGRNVKKIQHMIEDSSCRIKYKRPHDSDNGHRDNTWKKEYRTIKRFLPELSLCKDESKYQAQKDRQCRNHKHQFKRIKKCLYKVLVFEHINIIIQEYKLTVESNAERSGTGKRQIDGIQHRYNHKNDRKNQRGKRTQSYK